MTSEGKDMVYDEKNGSPATSAVDQTGVGHVSGMRRRFPGFSLEVRQEPSSFAVSKNASNADFDPIPPSKRTWNWGAYVAYWMADAWAVSNWEVGELISQRNVYLHLSNADIAVTASSMIQVGLDWRMAIGACVLGNFIMGLVITVNGRMGAIVSYSLHDNRIR